MAIRGVGITNFLPEEKKNQARRCQILRLIFCTDGNPWSLTVLCGKTECVCVCSLFPMPEGAATRTGRPFPPRRISNHRHKREEEEETTRRDFGSFFFLEKGK